ncbi:MAG: glycosyltransferase [Alphaproteobacteria bacterium]|nr:glycosyltransferase [Alphaproteobacteria bacterium]
MRKKKIAICLRDMKIGGVESVCIRTLDALLKNPDLEIVMITYCPVREPVYRDWFAAHPQIKTHVLYPCRWLGTDLARFFLWRIIQHVARDVYRWFRRVTMDTRRFADIDVFVDYYNFSFDKEFRRFPQPKVSWWHSSINSFVNGKYIRFLPRYDMMVTLTDGFVDDFRAMYPEFKNKIMRIYNPMDVAAVRARADAVAMTDMGEYFCCVSRLYADKDIETVLRAFDAFWTGAGRPDVRLVIVGGGSHADRFKSIAASLPAANNIVFAGPQPNPFGFMAGAMANILSSYSEGLPTVLIEGAAVGTVNIASDCKNGPREILMDGRAGLLFTPGDASALARHMADVWRGRVDTDALARRAASGLNRFDADEIAGQITDLIQKL